MHIRIKGLNRGHPKGHIKSQSVISRGINSVAETPVPNFSPLPSSPGSEKFCGGCYRRVPGAEIGAVIVGINKYSDPAWTLYQCVRDAQNWRRLFIDAYEIPAQNIKTLYDSEATKYNICQALREVNKKYKYRVYAHSGHGFRVLNRDTNKFEEGLCTHDLTWNRAGLFLDVDIHNLLGGPERTWLVIDACHSGGLSKKSIQKSSPGARIKTVVAPSGGVKLGKPETLKAKDFVCLLSSGSDEASYENSNGGVFSTNAINILLHQPEMPFDELFDEIGNRITYDQHPVVVASDTNLGLFCIKKGDKNWKIKNI